MWLHVCFSLRIRFLSVYRPNVTLSHDATCVPSTCSDDDGHPERSSSVVPGEPTGQRGQYVLTPAPAHIYRCACAALTCLFGLKGEHVLYIFKHAPVQNQQSQIPHFHLCKYTLKKKFFPLNGRLLSISQFKTIIFTHGLGK